MSLINQPTAAATAVAAILTGETLESLSADELLSLDIGQIGDVEAFKIKPSGMYGWEVTAISIDEVGNENKKAIKVEYNLLEVIELEDEADAEDVGEMPCKYTENYFLEGGKGFGTRMFATIFRQLAQEAGVTMLSDIMEAGVGATGGGFIKAGTYKCKKTGEIKPTNQIDATTVVWN
jgi:hypothetical protein